MSSRLNYQDLSQLMRYAEDTVGALESIATSMAGLEISVAKLVEIKERNEEKADD